MIARMSDKTEIIPERVAASTTGRDAIKTLLLLKPEELDFFCELAPDGSFIGEESAEKLLDRIENLASRGFGMDEIVATVSLVDLIYDTMVHESKDADDVVADLTKLAATVEAPPPQANVAALLRLFNLGHVSRAKRRTQAIAPIMPVLSRVRMEWDLRLVGEGKQELEFAPVIIARFDGDEQLAGADFVTFQMEEPELIKLRDSCERMIEQLARLRATLGDRLL
jgi:hypothetical protein